MFAGVDVTGVDDLVASPSARIATQMAQDAQRSENRCAAAKVIAAGRLHAIRFAAISAGDDGMGPRFGNIADKGATVEVATALGVSTSKATTIIGLSILLDDLPDLRAVFLHGDMDFYRVNMIATTIAGHEPLVRKQLEAEAIRLDADTAMSHRQHRDRLGTATPPSPDVFRRRMASRSTGASLRSSPHCALVIPDASARSEPQLTSHSSVARPRCRAGAAPTIAPVRPVNPPPSWCRPPLSSSCTPTPRRSLAMAVR
ncbi:MAG: hypothetical protein NTW76_20495 [Corynebacteriales bacterium]|nr:hypothetical protein [Mycobacteriales bacterium]